MMRKFAVALIATTMLVAPALAADAVKPAAPAAAATTAAPADTLAPKTEAKTSTKTVKVAHHHAHHVTVAKNGKPVTPVKTAKPVEAPPTSTATAAATSATPAGATAVKPDVKVIKASKEPKKRHVKTSNVSKPVQPTPEGKAGREAAHEVKGNKVISY
jgi:hypothetical protein